MASVLLESTIFWEWDEQIMKWSGKTASGIFSRDTDEKPILLDFPKSKTLDFWRKTNLINDAQKTIRENMFNMLWVFMHWWFTILALFAFNNLMDLDKSDELIYEVSSFIFYLGKPALKQI